MTDAVPASVDLTPERRRDIERWFARRGVPQLIAGFSSEPAMDRRAAPLIALWLIVGTIRDWGTRPDWSPAANLAGIAATIGWMAIVWTVVSRLRRRSPRIRPATFDLLDIATIAFAPVLPAAVIDADPGEAVRSFLGALTGVGVIYVIVGFGLVEIIAWAAERLVLQATHIVELLARTLPMLLILVVFLLFAGEMWEAAHAMSWLELALLLLLLLVLAALLVVITLRRELRQIEARTDADGVRAEATETPAAPLVALATGALPAARLRRLERSNVTLLVAVPHLLQAIAVGVVVMGFLVLFALVAIPASVQQGWIGEPTRDLVAFGLLDEHRTVSEEMVIVSAVLGGIVGLYFSALAITDPTYRPEGFDRELSGVRQILAVRALYLAALRSSAEAPRSDGLPPGRARSVTRRRTAAPRSRAGRATPSGRRAR